MQKGGHNFELGSFSQPHNQRKSQLKHFPDIYYIYTKESEAAIIMQLKKPGRLAILSNCVA